jgi:hypothetical protein
MGEFEWRWAFDGNGKLILCAIAPNPRIVRAMLATLT